MSSEEKKEDLQGEAPTPVQQKVGQRVKSPFRVAKLNTYNPRIKRSERNFKPSKWIKPLSTIPEVKNDSNSRASSKMIMSISSLPRN
jgi:hypothetical protein